MALPSGELRPVPPDAPVAGHAESGVVQGVTKTNSSTGEDSYKTQFVKVYQDAGVIGASMLTLLVLCFLLGMFSLRLLKMYVALTESRDKLDAARTEFSSKMVEKIIILETTQKNVITELRADHTIQTTKLDAILSCQDRMNERLDRYNEANHDRRSGNSGSSRNPSGAA